MRIKIDAIDTLFFKDGKPFSMGDETWADGIFPPPPSVIYGALRSIYFSEHPEKLQKVYSKEVQDPAKKKNALNMLGRENWDDLVAGKVGVVEVLMKWPRFLMAFCKIRLIY